MSCVTAAPAVMSLYMASMTANAQRADGTFLDGIAATFATDFAKLDTLRTYLGAADGSGTGAVALKAKYVAYTDPELVKLIATGATIKGVYATDSAATTAFAGMLADGKTCLTKLS
jgi:hypothetical protein